MSKPQYAILRFAKYKGPEIGNIEAHNERTKEKYASNPDVDISRSKYNFHLIEPERKYRAEADRQIKEAGCRTRSDSVRVVEALVTATPEFFQRKKKSEKLKEKRWNIWRGMNCYCCFLPHLFLDGCWRLQWQISNRKNL